MVTVMFPPHAVTRWISSGREDSDVLSELTLLLIEMARHAGSLGVPKGAARPVRGPVPHGRRA